MGGFLCVCRQQPSTGQKLELCGIGPAVLTAQGRFAFAQEVMGSVTLKKDHRSPRHCHEVLRSHAMKHSDNHKVPMDVLLYCGYSLQSEDYPLYSVFSRHCSINNELAVLL